MDHLLKPERFNTDPICDDAEIKWRHWKKTFENFLDGIDNLKEQNKLPLLINYVSSNVFKFIQDCNSYCQAISTLDSLFIKKRNVIMARYCLSTRLQQSRETVGEYFQILNQLSEECDFSDVKAEEYKREYMRDAFIRGLKCNNIRQRILKNASLTLEQAFEQARTLELAEAKATPDSKHSIKESSHSKEIPASVASSIESYRKFFSNGTS